MFHHDGRISQALQIREWHHHQYTLHFIMLSIEKPLLLLVFSVSLSGCIPSQGSELLEVLVHRHTPLLQLQELLPHDTYQASRYIALEKLAFEGILGHYFILGK